MGWRAAGACGHPPADWPRSTKRAIPYSLAPAFPLRPHVLDATGRVTIWEKSAFALDRGFCLKLFSVKRTPF